MENINNEEGLVIIDSVDKYSQAFGLETGHPLVGVVDLTRASLRPQRQRWRYEVYALFLKNVKCGNIKYGRQAYDFQDGTIVSFAPGQVVELEMFANVQLSAKGLLFHPDFIKGTTLGREIRRYSFFSYASNEALHLSEEERQIVVDCLDKIDRELTNDRDKHSRRLICANIGLLLDYCMRFYERQFETRQEVNQDIIVRFEQLLDDYFVSDRPQAMGLPTVKYFADKVYLSPNYFGDMVRKQTGKTPSDYIQDKVIDLAKQELLASGKTMTQIAYNLGFQYPQHLSRTFKKAVGLTPNEYRSQAFGSPTIA